MSFHICVNIGIRVPDGFMKSDIFKSVKDLSFLLTLGKSYAIAAGL